MSDTPTTIFKAMDRYDRVYTFAAAICIVVALWYAPKLDRENWSYVAGPLFTLASGLLFIVAIRFQIREHRLALSEMKQANINHSELARIAKQEKEFNVCLVAIEEARRQLDGFKDDEFRGADAIHSIMIKWMQHFQEDRFNDPRQLGLLREALGGPNYAIGYLMPYADEIKELRVKLYWILDSVLDDSPFRKVLDDRDARFIRAIVIPMINQVSAAVIENLDYYNLVISQLLREPESRLEALRFRREGLLMCKEKADSIRRAGTERGYPATLII